MLLAYIKSHGLRKLIKADSNLNSAKLIKLLKDDLILDLDEGEIFRYDGASCH